MAILLSSSIAKNQSFSRFICDLQQTFVYAYVIAVAQYASLTSGDMNVAQLSDFFYCDAVL